MAGTEAPRPPGILSGLRGLLGFFNGIKQRSFGDVGFGLGGVGGLRVLRDLGL